MTELPVEVTATSYQVSCLPETHRDHRYFAVNVEYRGLGRWAVVRMGECLAPDGEWHCEPIPSDRAEEWKSAHYSDLPTALERAKAAAPKITVNGRTVADVLAACRRPADE